MVAPEIRIGVVGRILTGEELGRYVKVVDDEESSGGYLILTAGDRQLGEDGADAWVEGADDLRGFFAESAWAVEWLA